MLFVEQDEAFPVALKHKATLPPLTTAINASSIIEGDQTREPNLPDTTSKPKLLQVLQHQVYLSSWRVREGCLRKCVIDTKYQCTKTLGGADSAAPERQ